MYFHYDNYPYIAVIGDIRDSRKIENRSEAQKKLQRVLLSVNEKYTEDIASKFTITLGDEFQGLFHSGHRVLQVISEIERALYPKKIRFGIGIGVITTDIDPERALGADGPGYYMARNAVDFLKENENRKQAALADIRLEADGDNDECVAMLNSVLSLMCAIKDSWSERQREIIWDMAEHMDNQTDVAARLGIRQPTVHKSLSKGYYYTYKNASETVERVLGEIRRRDA
jgi:hypothetical protein